MQPQIWFCKVCRTVGLVYTDEHEGVWSGVEKVVANHRHLSPNCEGAGNKVRCFSHGVAKVSNVPNWARPEVAHLLKIGQVV